MRVTIPPGLPFAALGLEREPVTLYFRFWPGPLTQVCRANALDPAAVLANAELAFALIVQWYLLHLAAGGEADPIAESIRAEADANRA